MCPFQPFHRPTPASPIQKSLLFQAYLWGTPSFLVGNWLPFVSLPLRLSKHGLQNWMGSVKWAPSASPWGLWRGACAPWWQILTRIRGGTLRSGVSSLSTWFFSCLFYLGCFCCIIRSLDLDVLFQTGEGAAQECIIYNLHSCVVVRSHSTAICSSLRVLSGCVLVCSEMKPGTWSSGQAGKSVTMRDAWCYVWCCFVPPLHRLAVGKAVATWSSGAGAASLQGLPCATPTPSSGLLHAVFQVCLGQLVSCWPLFWLRTEKALRRKGFLMHDPHLSALPLLYWWYSLATVNTKFYLCLNLIIKQDVSESRGLFYVLTDFVFGIKVSTA